MSINSVHNTLTGYFYKILSYKIIRYAIVGGISTFIHIGIASAYIYFISESLFQANVVGFLFAYVFSYLMQSKLVFQHAIQIKKAIKYFIVQFGSLMISIALSTLLNENTYIKTIAVVMCMPLITFVVHKIWTFKEEEEK